MMVPFSLEGSEKQTALRQDYTCICNEPLHGLTIPYGTATVPNTLCPAHRPAQSGIRRITCIFNNID